MKYRAFLSYSHADRKWARWLHRALESFRLPKNLENKEGDVLPKRLGPVFRDRDELPSSASLSDAVNDALADSQTLIVICSPNAVASRWVNEEIRTFRHLGRANRILCFMVDGEPYTGGDDECFPPALTETDELSGVLSEPVAADARPQGDGRRNAMLKIVAGMLGIGFDALKQRDHRRYQRRMATITVSSVLIAAITIALAFTATIARNEADFRRGQAEDLIDFMLGDLQEQLREIGRLDLYQGIGDEALEYFAGISQESASDYSLSQRARNLRQIGEVKQEQGDLPAAFKAFVESQRIMEMLAARNLLDSETQIGLANSYFYVGSVHWERGDLQQARQQFELVPPIVDELSAREPANTTWLLERGYAYTNLGRILELEGSLTDALDAYQSVMTINQKLTELEPDNPEWILELGFAHNNIGKLVSSLGRLDEAKSHYREDLSIKKKLYEENPDHNLWRSYQAASEYFLGRLLVNSNEVDEGKELLLAALESFTELMKVDPERTWWVARRANVERELGELAIHDGQVERGNVLLEAAIHRFDDLLQNEEEHAGWRRGLAGCLIVAADVALRSGDRDKAADQLHQASEIVDLLLQQEPSSRDSQMLAIRRDLYLARAMAVTDVVVAEAASVIANQRLDQFFSESLDPWVLELKAVALLQLGQRQEAMDIQNRLRAMGFRESRELEAN